MNMSCNKGALPRAKWSSGSSPKAPHEAPGPLGRGPCGLAGKEKSNMARGTARFIRSVGLVVFVSCMFSAGSNAISSQSTSQIPRSEHPKPQFVRDAWINLNGQWDFAMDSDVAGIKERGEK